MHTTLRPVASVGCLVLALTLGAAAPALSQGSKSGSAAKELSEVLDRLKLDSIAAVDPAEPGAFVAALYFQGSQLLVVSAKYSAPALLTDKLAKKDYRDVYIDLNAASIAGSKIFVMDQAADGLVARPGDGSVDSWEQGNTTTAFDGEWRRAKLTEEEYDKRFSAADEQYARILSLLSAQAKKSGS